MFAYAYPRTLVRVMFSIAFTTTVIAHEKPPISPAEPATPNPAEPAAAAEPLPEVTVITEPTKAAKTARTKKKTQGTAKLESAPPAAAPTASATQGRETAY